MSTQVNKDSKLRQSDNSSFKNEKIKILQLYRIYTVTKFYLSVIYNKYIYFVYFSLI